MSRAFAQFAVQCIGEQLHELLLQVYPLSAVLRPAWNRRMIEEKLLCNPSCQGLVPVASVPFLRKLHGVGRCATLLPMT